MLVFGVDTSLPILSVALVDGEALIGSIALEGRGSRNEKLLPAIDWLLTEAGVERAQIDLFAVTRGPGSFTGVRIGLATVQGLALVLGREVCTMSTHEAIAQSESGRFAVVDDAGRGESYLSLFDGGREVEPPRLAAANEIADLAAGMRIVTVASFLQQGNAALHCARRAAVIEASGEGSLHRDITPIYVRLAEAEVKLQQKQNG